MDRKRPSSETIDFLRGIAALYVVINHTRGSFFRGGEKVVAEAGGISGLSLYDIGSLALLQLTSMGQEFVILFFCLSGIAMAHSIERTGGPLTFYARRLIRIWPPFLVAIVFAVAVGALISLIDSGSPLCQMEFCSPDGLLRMALYLDVSSPLTPQFWSLPYEVIFYVLCPLLLASRNRVLLSFGAACLLALIGMVAFGIRLNPSGVVLVDFFINALLWFTSGAIGYHFFHRVPAVKGWWLASITAALLVAAFGIKTLIGDSNLASNLIMVALTLLLVRNLPQGLAANNILNWGYFSYSLYIFHFAVIALLAASYQQLTGARALDIGHYYAWLLPLPIVLASGWLMYQVAERPTNAWLRLIRARQTVTTAAA